MLYDKNVKNSRQNRFSWKKWSKHKKHHLYRNFPQSWVWNCPNSFWNLNGILLFSKSFQCFFRVFFCCYDCSCSRWVKFNSLMLFGQFETYDRRKLRLTMSTVLIFLPRENISQNIVHKSIFDNPSSIIITLRVNVQHCRNNFQRFSKRVSIVSSKFKLWNEYFFVLHGFPFHFVIYSHTDWFVLFCCITEYSLNLRVCTYIGHTRETFLSRLSTFIWNWIFQYADINKRI